MTSPIAWGAIFPVNSTITGSQFLPQIAALKDGSFVAVWTDISQTGADTSGMAVRGQLFNADGSKKGGEFLVNTTTLGSQGLSDVTVLNDGRFVVAWFGDDGYVWARAYQANGTAIGNDFRVSSTQNDGYAISALTSGGFAVSYAGDGGKTYIQSFDANLQKSGAEVVTERSSGHMQLVGLQGQYINCIETLSGKIRGEIRNNDGSAGSTGFDISTGTDNYNPTAAKLVDGRIVVIWEHLTYSEAGHEIWTVKGQILNANGTKSGGELLLSAPGLVSCQDVCVTALADGGFAVGYVDRHDENSSDIHVATFNSRMARVTDTILSQTSGGFGGTLDIAALADGRLAVTWHTESSTWDGYDFGIQGQIVDLRQSGVNLTGTAADDRYYGSKFNDAIRGEAGNDRLFGDGGNDVLAGGLGKDVLFGREGKDTLTGGKGSDAFVFDTAPMVGRVKHFDRITDFNGRADKIYLDDAIFKGLSRKVGSLDAPVKIDRKAFWKGNAAHDKNDRIVVKSSGNVLYDADGSGKGKAVVIAKIDKHAVRHVDAGDFLLI